MRDEVLIAGRVEYEASPTSNWCDHCRRIARCRSVQVSFVDTQMPFSGVQSLGINNAGQIYLNDSGGQFFRQPNGTISTLPPPPGYTGVKFWTINNSAVLGGEAFTAAGGTRAVIRQADGSFVIPIPSGNSRGSGINDAGDAVGWTPGGTHTPFLYRASDATVTPLPEPAGSTATNAYNMNNSGAATGVAFFTGLPTQAWRYVPGIGVSLIPLSPNASEPTDINNAGVVVGTGPGIQPFRWNVDGSVTTLPGGAGVAYGINDANEVVGQVLAGGLARCTGLPTRASST